MLPFIYVFSICVYAFSICVVATTLLYFQRSRLREQDEGCA